jgi:hypothetical protein
VSLQIRKNKLANKTVKGDYANIPEYFSDDSMGNRLMALVRLEQFMDENTFTPGVMADLEQVAAIARKAEERRIYTIAELILQQSRKYLKK